MSTDALQRVFQIKDIHSPSKYILTALAWRANQDYYCCPTIKQLAADTNLSARVVSQHLQKLSKNGYVTITKRYEPDGTRISNGYTLNFDLSQQI